MWRGELDARRKEYDKAGKAGASQQRQALLMGLPLDTAKKWLAARRGDIEPADQAFIEASVRAERAVARNRQRLQAAVGVLMLGTIVSLLGVIFKDEIGELWFEQTTLRRYIATNFKDHVLKPEAERALKPGDPLSGNAPRIARRWSCCRRASSAWGLPTARRCAAGPKVPFAR